MKPTPLALLWHMHQPPYRLRGERACFMPWVRLHAIRSYYDMVRVLEEFPEVRVTFNLTPVLIEQIRAYEAGGSDLFWDAASVPAEELDEAQRAFLFEHFFSAHRENLIGELPRYADLLERRGRARRQRGPAEAWKELSAADFRDLQLLFDLAWFGFKAREDFPELRALSERGLAYTQQNVAEVHAVEREILRRLVPLYRAAAGRGQAEISTSPYAHPILPLLIDSDCAREALPHAPLPPRFAAPEDARAQVQEGLDLAERELGSRPRGVWPSEGALSHEAVELLGRCGVAWAASDEQVLAASDLEGPPDPRRVWELEGGGSDLEGHGSEPEGRSSALEGGGGSPALVFRDQDLSDRIGFTYSRMEPARAVADFLHALGERAAAVAEGSGLVLVALDGENPWEHYPRAGARFLRALYAGLGSAPGLRCATVSEAIAGCEERGRIRRLRAGSWIHADLGTWIGGPEKNRAWSLLGEVRLSLAGALEDPDLPEERRRQGWESLRAAEASDWFWWLDGQHASPYRAQFDLSFRSHLRQACEALGRPAPEALEWPVPSPERRLEPGGLREPSAWLAPRIDGYEGDFFEWHGAVRLEWESLSLASSMERARRGVRSLRYGFSPRGELLLRLDPDAPSDARGLRGLDLSFRRAEETVHLRVSLDERGDLEEAIVCPEAPRQEGPCPGGRPCAARAAARKILELAVPCREVGLAPGQPAGLLLRLGGAGDEVPLREIGLRVPEFPSAGASAGRPVNAAGTGSPGDGGGHPGGGEPS